MSDVSPRWLSSQRLKAVKYFCKKAPSKIFDMVLHCVKHARIRSYSGPYFPAFRLNTDQNNSEYGHFLRSFAYASEI